jgi:hypothetical protein
MIKYHVRKKDQCMALAEEDIQYIKEHLPEWINASRQLMPIFDLTERIVRVEEELKHQREVFTERFSATDRHLEELRSDMNRRFEAMDRRFENMESRLERQFYWLVGLMVSLSGILLAAVKLLPGAHL